MRRFVMLVAALAVTGCVEATTEKPAEKDSVPPPVPVSAFAASNNSKIQDFLAVVRRMEPVARRECRRRAITAKCNFTILIDNRNKQPANAFQALDDKDQPVIVFTRALIQETRNQDELAFVLGHEVAHHILEHISKTRDSALEGFLVGGLQAAVKGGDAKAIERAEQRSAFIGIRKYSKQYELEADALGTVITAHSGYNPLRGAQYFHRIPDPGDKYLGSHPPNAKRLQVVRQAVSKL